MAEVQINYSPLFDWGREPPASPWRGVLIGVTASAFMWAFLGLLGYLAAEYLL